MIGKATIFYNVSCPVAYSNNSLKTTSQMISPGSVYPPAYNRMEDRSRKHAHST